MKDLKDLSDNTEILNEINHNLKVIKNLLYWILGIMVFAINVFSLYTQDLPPFIFLATLIVFIPLIIIKLPVKNRFERAEEALKKANPVK